MFYNKRIIKFTAKVLLITLTCQLVLPAVSFGLTSGPSQPEVQSFEPVGTTDMVDMFTGDFVYNIPLLDVEGYPVNIAYHSGGDMEQEASWVGLGWNINPGVINRSVRGMPDDFKGETISKTVSIKPEKNVRVGLGVGADILGVGSPLIKLSADLNMSLNMSNYRGVSADFSLGAGVNVAGFASAGINMGVGSQSGADVDYNAGIRFSTSMIMSSDVAVGVGFSFGHGYNTRSGLKDKSFSLSAGVSYQGHTVASGSLTRTVPIGIKNIIPVITNRSQMTMYRGQIKLGGELFGIYGHAAVFGMLSRLEYDKEGSMKGYGYLYAQDADDASIMDFTRDRDGMFSETMSYLPVGNMTYDIYSVNGQGTGGSFRPFRNDFGSVYDPAVSSSGKETGVNVEAGIGNLFEIGADITVSETQITSGPWQDYKRPFTNKKNASLYENVYFKQAGEATAVNPGLFSAMQGVTPLDGIKTGALPLTKPGSDIKRDPRGALVYYFTAEEAAKYGVASSQKIYSYDSNNGFAGGPNILKTAFDRESNGRKKHHISEMVQVQTDGRKYVYGLPAMNNIQNEVNFAVAGSGDSSGLIQYNATDASASNNNGRDHFYSKTTTPAYAHSYLLTSVLSTDYVDVSGNGPSDDDFGSFTKFNYTRKDSAFKWKAPYGSGKAQYNPGFKSDKSDDKASFLSGSREQWMLHSIETKNFVAEFYTSTRLDGKGDELVGSSYKLDSIKLFNKHDRFINTTQAVPVKTVIFNYDYSLCKQVANNSYFIQNPGSTNNSTGKLTLKKIYVRYGNSDRSMISPYQFDYDANYNYNYNVANKDRWGAYKPNDPAFSNADFPFVKQTDADLDKYASAWSLSNITLPSGGNIKIKYEADDYAYVQDKHAMEMFMVTGIGSTEAKSSSNMLYNDKDRPNLYFYFKRRIDKENGLLSAKENYLKNQSLLYYNFNTRIVDNSYEPIKGYAEIESVGYCTDDPLYGYVKVKPMQIQGGGATLNPVTYTAINFARYYLPHIIFPGDDPDASDIQNVLAGLQYAFSELVSFTKNPVKRMVQENKGKEIKLASSYMRLTSVGLKKKGGGQRVKNLEFADNWSALAGGNAQNATYGKSYDYTTEDQAGYGTISSGVASYEPQIGGDENPFRLPVNYSVQKGSTWPPNDPVGVYQELPVGESLYPGAVVGYSRVSVKSIHQAEGKSSQGLDIYDFYTAKDFPVQALATSLNQLENSSDYSFTEQTRRYKGSQGYTLIFNDMHGKPKRTEHRIIKPAFNGTPTSELVSYQQYIYNTEGGKLSNTVPVIEYDPASGKMKKTDKQVGYEADLTIDTREKKEETSSNTLYLNLNVFMIAIIPVPVPFWYDYDFNFRNQFNSVVATKVVQQYGILKEIQSSQEGAVTTVRNEAFDPVTGQALITSVNNEFSDREYSVNYPAYWGYKSMGPSYQNTGYQERFDSVKVSNYMGELPTASSVMSYNVGDELLITYNYNGGSYTNNVWVSGFRQNMTSEALPTCYLPGIPNNLDIWDTVNVHLSYVPSEFAHPIIKPRYKYQAAAWPNQTVNGNGALTNVTVKVIRSGAKNQLNESIQSYTAMEKPFDGNNFLKDKLDRLIDISGREFSDTLTAILPKYDTFSFPGQHDSLNEFVNGTRQIKRLFREYAYIKNRSYESSTARNAGLFSATTLWHKGTATAPATYVDSMYFCRCQLDSMGLYAVCYTNLHTLYHVTGYIPTNTLTNSTLLNSYLTPMPQDDKNWVVARAVTKWSPWGYEIENLDAIGNYTAAMYGYNQQLPVALAQNARQHEVWAENFEDYQLLQVVSSVAAMNFSPMLSFFTQANNLTGDYYKVYSTAGSNSLSITGAVAHTGIFSLLTSGAVQLSFPVKQTPVLPGQPRYMPFTLEKDKPYVISYWFRPKVLSTSPVSNYTPPGGFIAKSNIIDGWQQVELTFRPTGTTYSISLPGSSYLDDIRIMPAEANMKAFVYHPVNQRLVATLDENNFASFYEYDQEGNLVRTKKETEKGIVTVMESRSANVKKSN